MHKKNVIAVTYQAAFELAFMTGIRPGELWALRTTDVDLETRKLRVERAKETKTTRIKSTRTHEQRDVDLSPSTVEMMGVQRISHGVASGASRAGTLQAIYLELPSIPTGSSRTRPAVSSTTMAP